jgi:glycosyltransferase involved in cell wall biosynthesis
MKNVVFLSDNEWAFGSIHYGLFKYLWNYGYNCNLLQWDKHYTKEEITELNSHIDFWITTPHGYLTLKSSYDIAPERCVVIAHSVFDLTDYIKIYGIEDFSRFRKYGVISNYLKDYSKELNIPIDPIVFPIGINYNSFYSEPSKELKVVGYASAYYERHEFTQEMIDQDQVPNLRWKKRGYLVKEACEKAGLEFRIANHYHNSFVTMPGFYKFVDAVVIPSMQEGGGLPSLEAGAAGKLVIGTSVGYWQERVGILGGIQVPIEEKEFIEFTVNALKYYKDNPNKYREKCYVIREHAKSYDWSNYVEQWVKELQ